MAKAIVRKPASPAKTKPAEATPGPYRGPVVFQPGEVIQLLDDLLLLADSLKRGKAKDAAKEIHCALRRRVDAQQTEKARREAEPRSLRDRLTALIDSLPADKARSAFEKWREDFKMKLEIAEHADVDDITICIAAAEEVEQISGSLTALVESFGKNGGLAENLEEEKFANLIRPTQRWLASVVSSDFPGNLANIRKHVEDSGYGDQIRG